MARIATQLWCRARGGALGALFASALAVGLLTACGITVGSGEERTELFKSLTLTGDFRLGGDISMHLEYENPYTVEVTVRCDLVDATPGETPEPIASATAEVPPEATPTSAPIPKPSPTIEGFLRSVLGERLPANPDGGLADRVTPVPGVLEIGVPAPELPGEYKVRCYTPDDPNNQISEQFTVLTELAPG